MLGLVRVHIERFSADCRGNFAILFGIVATVVIFAAGSAVDFANFVSLKRSTQAALDAASITATIDIRDNGVSIADARAKASQFLQVNLPDSAFIDPQVVASTLRLTMTDDLAEGTAEVVADVDLEVPTLFATVLGFDSLEANIASAAGFSQEIFEIAFVLDTTGSMGNLIEDVDGNLVPRIDVLEETMINTLNTLFPGGGVNEDRIRVALVPYALSVNLGEDFHEAAVGFGSPSSPVGVTPVNFCVTEREGVNTFTDVAPLPITQDDIDNDIYTLALDELPQDLRTKRLSLHETEESLRDDIIDGTNNSPCPPVALRPLTNNVDDLIADVQSYEPAGFTGGHMGINWGLNVLSEEWQGFWPADAAPADYGAPNIRKILIVMTDGAFNREFIDDTPGSTQAASSNAAREFCREGQDINREIEIFTIAFGDDTGPVDLLQFCASEDVDPGDQHFFFAINGAQLTQAFEAILSEVPQIALTQ